MNGLCKRWIHRNLPLHPASATDPWSNFAADHSQEPVVGTTKSRGSGNRVIPNPSKSIFLIRMSFIHRNSMYTTLYRVYISIPYPIPVVSLTTWISSFAGHPWLLLRRTSEDVGSVSGCRGSQRHWLSRATDLACGMPPFYPKVAQSSAVLLAIDAILWHSIYHSIWMHMAFMDLYQSLSICYLFCWEGTPCGLRSSCSQLSPPQVTSSSAAVVYYTATPSVPALSFASFTTQMKLELSQNLDALLCAMASVYGIAKGKAHAFTHISWRPLDNHQASSIIPNVDAITWRPGVATKCRVKNPPRLASIHVSLDVFFLWQACSTVEAMVDIPPIHGIW